MTAFRKILSKRANAEADVRAHKDLFGSCHMTRKAWPLMFLSFDMASVVASQSTFYFEVSRSVGFFLPSLPAGVLQYITEDWPIPSTK
jgi:hypothetical protein